MSRLRGPVIVVCALATVLATSSFTAATLDAVRARVETAPNFDDEAGGDADADDPAIWRHPGRPADSVVLGTLKNGGLTAVDLRGRELRHVPTPPGGRFNNVDVVTGARVGGRTRDLAVVSDRGLDRLRVYAIDPRGARAGAAVLTDVTTAAPPLAFSAGEDEVAGQRTAYGLAVWADPAGGAPWVVVSRRHETRLGLFRLTAEPGGRVGYRPVALVDLPDTFRVAGVDWSPCAEPGERPQVEGMVVDRVDQVLYAAQEDVGVWRVPLSRAGFGRPALVERVREFGRPAAYDEETEECVPAGPPSPAAGEHLSADAEGLAIAYPPHGPRTLLASSQGDSTFARYRVTPTGLRYLGGFAVVDSQATDGVQHSDGAAVTTAPLGRGFPHGLLVVHDGENTPDGGRVSTNFKLLDARVVTGR
jgi:3-phytase